jgi:exodeoxyribonuclease VII small subunit
MPKKTILEPSESATPSFEVAFQELEEIVAQLERGDLPLEQALELHERGQKLAAYCATQLDQAELRVKKLEISQD